jgi:hypothetical protein
VVNTQARRDSYQHSNNVIPANGLVEKPLAIYYLVTKHQIPRLESLGY